VNNRGFLGKKSCKIHLMGIGGAGMSALAQLLLEKGHKVSGCDMSRSSYLEKMLHEGVPIFMGHDKTHLEKEAVDLLVYSSAISPQNPELLYAKETGIPIAKRAEILSMLFNESIGIGVAGAHGKTTTSSMIAFILDFGGISPSVAIGGELCDIGGNAKLGEGNHMVAELDESDGSFELFQCSIGVVTNIDWDHVDHYPDIVSVRKSFCRFLQQTKGKSSIILCAADKGVKDLLDCCKIPEGREVVTYGWDTSCNWQAANVQHIPGGGVLFTVRHEGKALGEIRLRLSGNHNALNALAACAVGISLGIPFDVVAQGLHGFCGAKRRLQKVYSQERVLIYDDYGHHPREIRATLEALRNIFPDRRLLIAFQPHRYSRTAAMYEDFAQALAVGDKVFLLPIYSADESNLWGISSKDIEGSMIQKGYNCTYCNDMEEARERILQSLGTRDLILTLGAGNVNLLGPILQKFLEEEEARKNAVSPVLAKTF